MNTTTKDLVRGALEKFRPCDHPEYEECGTSGIWRKCHACGLQFAAKRHDAIREEAASFDEALSLLAAPVGEQEPSYWLAKDEQGAMVSHAARSLQSKEYQDIFCIPLFTHPPPQVRDTLVERVMEVAEPYLTLEQCVELRSRLTSLFTLNTEKK